MKPSTEKSLSRLLASPWFENVGQPIADDRVIQVKSWTEATRSSASEEWKMARMVARISFMNSIADASSERADQWNATAEMLSPHVDALVETKARPLLAAYGLGEPVFDGIWTDLFLFAMECEHDDIVKPGFFSGLAFFYAQGHLPCGWRGDFPEGQLVVY